VDTRIEGNRPGQLLVPPGRDEKGVASADRGLHDELPLADGSIVEQCAHQPVDRIAAEVLRHGQDVSTSLGGADDAVATADGQRQRFLTEGVQPQVEEIAGHPMMRPGISRAGGRLQPVGLPDHGCRIGEDGRSAAEERQRLIGQIVGVALVQVAHRHELDGTFAAARQLRQPRQMPPPHPPAADDCQPNWIFCQAQTPSFRDRSRHQPRRSQTRMGPGSRLAQA